MKNHLVVRILEEIASFLEIQGESFKPRAYRRAASSVLALSEPIEGLVAEGRHKALPGVGKAIAEKIEEIVNTGRLQYLSELKKDLPIDLYSLTRVEGVGPKTAKRLYEELGVCHLVDLERAARSGEIRGVEGLGEKSEGRILRGLAEAKRAADRMLLGEALSLSADLVKRLEETRRFDRLAIAGSLRRGRETVRDLDLLATSIDPVVASEAFVRGADVEEILVHGEGKSSVRLRGGVQVDLRIVPERSFGAAMQYFTGSKDHNVALRKRAVARGWKLNEYGLYDEDGHVLAGEVEEEIYDRLGLQYIPPELREDQGELGAAEMRTLPPLIQRSDLRGDLHMHTTWSDGRASIADMVEAARSHGHEYLAITDHARFAEVIGGLTSEGLRRQRDEIASINERLHDFRVLLGIEVNIQADGTLDIDERLLAKLDVVIASVHGHFHQSSEQMTARLVRACESEYVDILGHPTTRKIGERPPVEAHWDAVFEAAAEGGTALEINANPLRMDLSAELARRAIAAGARLAINTDAHVPEHLSFLSIGVTTARRGWATAADVINTCPAVELEARRQ